MTVAPTDRVVRTRRGWTPAVLPIALALMLLGAWAIFAPLTGPYFGYGFDTHTTWLASGRQWQLDIGPGIVAFVGGFLMLIPLRAPAWLAGLIAAIGGIWLLIGPSLYPLWASPIGPFGSTDMRMFKWIGFFYGTGALIVYLSGFAQGMLSRRIYVERERTMHVADEPLHRERVEVGPRV